MPPAATSSSRALAAILPLIATSPYEAHQKARTFASRYVKSTQYDTAIDVLFQSARELLKAGQLGSGTDLTSFLLDVYEAKGETVGEESKSECSARDGAPEANIFLAGRLTQLIALTGSAGLWRKTMIDKSIACVLVPSLRVIHLVSLMIDVGGQLNMGHAQQAIRISTIMSANCSTKVLLSISPSIGCSQYEIPDGAFDKAEIHLLASGQRDSARLLSRMMVEWSSAGGSPGTFALRGTIPYVPLPSSPSLSEPCGTSGTS